jgi:hypothetical protein
MSVGRFFQIALYTAFVLWVGVKIGQSGSDVRIQSPIEINPTRTAPAPIRR